MFLAKDKKAKDKNPYPFIYILSLGTIEYDL